MFYGLNSISQQWLSHAELEKKFNMLVKNGMKNLLIPLVVG